jgi:hypothetical protein
MSRFAFVDSELKIYGRGAIFCGKDSRRKGGAGGSHASDEQFR